MPKKFTEVERKQFETYGVHPDAVEAIVEQVQQPARELIDKFVQASQSGDYSNISKQDVFDFMNMLPREQQIKMVKWALQNPL